jgi:hypothetical protein
LSRERTTGETESLGARTCAWLRPLVIALVGVLLLGAAATLATHFVHSEQAYSSVGCLDSTCTSGMPMPGSMQMGGGSAGMVRKRAATVLPSVRPAEQSDAKPGASPTPTPSRR